MAQTHISTTHWGAFSARVDDGDIRPGTNRKSASVVHGPGCTRCT
ncbi:hypothetical protein H7I92_25815 [Mycobacterium riyadhense]|nr:hypothetical protein [Mycobacterium riyadhense]